MRVLAWIGSLARIQAVRTSQTLLVLRDEQGNLYDVAGYDYVKHGVTTVDIIPMARRGEE